MPENLIKINLLGNFSISCSSVTVLEKDLSSQLCVLFSYLVIHKNRFVSPDEISRILWSEGTVNSSGALKNLAYRLRKVLENKKFTFFKELIISDQGSYKLNSKLIFEIDIDKFTELLSKSAQETDSCKKGQLLCKAVNLYLGDLTSIIPDQAWAYDYSQKYHNMYFTAVYTLLDLFDKTCEYDSMYTVAKKAVDIDCFAESAYRYIMLALYKKGRTSEALNYYKKTRELFYRELGIELSDTTRKFYNEISKSTNVLSVDIMDLKQDFMEKDDESKDTFYCELEVFKQIYRFNARTLGRIGTNFFMALMTISAINGEEPESRVREKAMEQLYKSIQSSLRRGDVFSLCSPTQYVIMLPALSFENGSEILQRTARNFKASYHSRKILLSHNLQTIYPPET